MKKNYIIALFFIIIPLIQLFAQPAWVRKQATPQENTLNDITRIPGTNKLVAVGEGSTVMISEDAGDSWQIILHPAGFTNEYICKTVYFINENVGFVGGSHNSLLRTTNGGYTWIKVLNDSSIHYQWCFNSIDFSNQYRGFAINESYEIYKTENSGLTWEELNLNTYFSPTTVSFLDENHGFITGSRTDKFIRTINGGLTWDSIGKPEGLPENNYFQGLKFINDSIGFMQVDEADRGEIYRTENGGDSWNLVYQGSDLSECEFCFSDQMNGVAIYVNFGCQNLVLITNDGGKTWERNQSDYLPAYSSNAIISTSSGNYIATGKNIGNMNHSIDGGVNWEPIGTHKIHGDISDAELFGDQNILAIVEDYNDCAAHIDLIRSEDCGENWSTVKSFGLPYANGFNFLNPDTGYLLLNSFDHLSIYRTTDAGLNWHEFSVADELNARDVSFYDYNNGMIVTEYSLYRTKDAGENWDKVNESVNVYSYHNVEYVNQYKLLVTARVGISLIVYISDDGGDTWQEKTLGDYYDPYALFVINDTTYFVATFNRIFKTTDGGNTWISGNFDQSYSILINSIDFPSADTGYAVGGGAYINALRTVDGGLNWTVSETNSSSVLNKVYFNDNNHGLAFGNLGVVLETTTGGVADAKIPGKAAEQIYFTPQPNPFIDQLTLQFETANNAGKATLVITDLSGKTIKIISIGGKIDQLLINLPQLPKGIYLLNLYKGNQLLQSEKVVKQ